jgi:hypothetical protein
MEVHAHTHTPRKKWTHYFWEFLMLFLAVFCGFLAEYQLEHVIENQREEKYISSLMEDLVQDTLDMHKDINGWQNIIMLADSVRSELEKQPGQRNHATLYRCAARLRFNNTFLYHDRTIEQLKSAGNYRLIRNKAIADSLVEYDSWIRTTLKGIETMYDMVMYPENMHLANKLFNSRFHDLRSSAIAIDSAYREHPELFQISPDKKDIEFEYYNSLSNYKNLNKTRVGFLKNLSGRATRLIEMIKEKYHLEL